MSYLNHPPFEHPEVLCLGETMVLVTPERAEPLVQAESFRLGIGGAESTVALYLAELGHPTSWISQVGNDPLGDRLIRILDRYGVDTSRVRVAPHAPTGVYFKDPSDDGTTTVYYYRSGSAASQMSENILDGISFESVRAVHVSGITAGLSASCRSLLWTVFRRARDAGVKVSFDVNYRPGVWSGSEAAPVLLNLAREADVVFVGRDEAEKLWGTASPETIAAYIQAPGLLIVKDGDVGATEFTTGTKTFVPAHAVDVVEAVGAGDAFAAGYLSVLLRGGAPDDRLRKGHDLAARALSSVSDFVPADGIMPAIANKTHMKETT
ncbi:sugar kinase [Arthrobacter subterraneus]|uniref:sugar kinase n=1 Tax=Arthrobacter subterraneus TaxID=335973 RepID=UPI0037F83BBC